MNQTTNTTAGIDLDHLGALARAATPGPWLWWTSNSFMRLSARGDGDVIHGERLHDGVCTVSIKRADAAFTEALDPTTVLHLIELARPSTSGSDKAAYNAQLRQEVSIMHQMLDDGEWGEHIATTAHGQNLETAITRLVGNASGSDGTAAAGARGLTVSQIEDIANEHGSGKNGAGNYLFRPLALIKFARTIEDRATSGSELADEHAPNEQRIDAWWKYVRSCKDARRPFLAYEEWIIEQACAALAQQAGAPAGYKMVPIEPTPEMQQAGFDTPGAHGYNASYRAMVAAAPAPAAQDERDAKDAALRAYIAFAANRRTELGYLSDEMEAVDAQARAAMSQPKTQGVA